MDFGGPASDFHMRLCSTLKGVGMDFPMGFLLVGIIINTMALIRARTGIALDARTIKDVLALKSEISLLCLLYGINVVFQFESLKVVPTHMVLDCNSLRLSRSVLCKKKPPPRQTLDDAQTLFNFLALVRYFTDELGPIKTGLLIEDFNRKSLVHLPAHTIRRPGVGLRMGANPFRPGASNKRQVSSVWTVQESDPISRPTHMTEVSNTKTAHTNPHSRPRSNIWFNPFKSKSKSKSKLKSNKLPSLARTNLDDENFPTLLSDAPLRMRRKPCFGLRHF